MNKKQPNSAFEFLFFAVFLAGALIVLSGLHSLILALQAGGWPTVQGTVTESRLTNRLAGTPEGEKRISTYSIKYEYQVNQHKYKGSVVGSGKLISPENAVEHYRIGRRVAVHYNPRKPGHSILEPGINAGNFLGLLWGLALIGMSLFMRYTTRGKGKKSESIDGHSNPHKSKIR